jgi:monoterpene epsilon-lactone hydrolase
MASELVVFDAMPHCHWKMIDIPESREALEIQAEFFSRVLDGRRKS